MKNLQKLSWTIVCAVISLIAAYFILPSEITETWTISDLVIMCLVQIVCVFMTWKD